MLAGPEQPFNVGVIVIVEVIGVVPLFTAVKDGILPVPLAANPIEVLEFVHVKFAPTGALVRF